jgi:hypothetical protein
MERRKFIGATAGAAVSMVAGYKPAAQAATKEKDAGYKPAALTAALTAALGDETLLDRPGELAALLKSEAAKIFANNRVEAGIGLFHLPSAETYRSFFAWDSGWNVIGMTHLDPEIALRELQTVFAVQGADGHVPHEVRTPAIKEKEFLRKLTIAAVKNQYDAEGRSAFIDPPSFLLAAHVLYEKTRDARVLGLLPGMLRCVEYLTGPRDLFGEGLVSIIHPWESGTDSAPVFEPPMRISIKNPLVALDYLYKYPALLNDCARLGWDLQKIAAANRFVVEDVGTNAITAEGIARVAALCRSAHEAGMRPEGAGQGDYQSIAVSLDARADKMVAAMERILWDEEKGFFFPRYDLKRRLLSKRTCLTGLLPLITGRIAKDKAERVINEHLLSPADFSGEWMVPFNSASEIEPERIPFENIMLWRGHCIWMNMNYLTALAASRCGRPELARAVTRATARLILRQGFREFYDSRTGQGGGAGGFTWPALVLDMMDKYGI